METSNIEEKKDNKVWLQKLKEESWEAELLISTVAIIGAVQLYKLLDWLTIYIIDAYTPDIYLVASMILGIGSLAITMLITMFVVHFLLRAYWVGLVGLNSVFPEYSLEDSAYSEIYTKKMLDLLPKLKHTIQDVDEVCSVIFSTAFFIFGMYTYLGLLGLVVMGLYNFTQDYITSWVWLIFGGGIFVISIIQMILTAIANMKRFKENENVQNAFFFIAKWGGYIYMGPMYRYLLQISMTFGTNYKKKKSLAIFMIVLFVAGLFIGTVTLGDSKFHYLVDNGIEHDQPNRTSVYYLSTSAYANLTKEGNFLLNPQIETDVVERSVFKLFIPLMSYEERVAHSIYGKYESEDSMLKEGARKKRAKWYWDRYNAYHEIQLNGMDIEVNLIRSNHAQSGQMGLLGYVNLQGVGQEMNTLRITKMLGEHEKIWEIPFRYIEN